MKTQTKPTQTPTLMQLPGKSVNVRYLRAQLGQLHDNEIDYIVRAVNAHEKFIDLVHALKERIEECGDCDGSGKEHKTSACGRCGGIGKVLENCTGLIDSVHEAIAKAEGRE